MHCTSCGLGVPQAVAKAPYCAFCGARRSDVSEEDAAALVALKTTRRERAASAEAPARKDRTVAATPPGQTPQEKPQQRRQEAPFTSDDLCVAFDPQAGFAFIGRHAPSGEAPRLRAYDVANRRVAWEALSGEQGIAEVDHRRLAVRGRTVYVLSGSEPAVALRALDLFTGKQKWVVERLSDTIESDSVYTPVRGLRVLDPFPPDQRGAVVLPGLDRSLTAIDRETGQLLWREDRELPLVATAIPGSGLVLFTYTFPNELINPFQRQPVAYLTGRDERKPGRTESNICRLDLDGRYGIFQVESWGWLDAATTGGTGVSGVVLHDFAVGKQVFFERTRDLDREVPSVMGDGRVFCALDGGRLFAAPHAKSVELLPMYRIRSMAMCGPTLFVLLEKRFGPGRRVLGVDPSTLAVRWDLGELATEPSYDFSAPMCSNGQVVALVTSPSGRRAECEIHGVDAAGSVLWKTPVGGWSGHYFLGGHLVVHAESERRWTILRPDDGREAGVCAARD